MSTTVVPDRFTTVPDEHALQASVVALEEHGSVSRSWVISMPRARRCWPASRSARR
jgi:hypothetical protein